MLLLPDTEATVSASGALWVLCTLRISPRHITSHCWHRAKKHVKLSGPTKSQHGHSALVLQVNLHFSLRQLCS